MSTSVTDEPRIPNYQPANEAAGTQQGGGAPQELRGNVGVHGFWRRGRQAVFDIRVTDIDAASSYKNTAPEKVLRRQEEAKKRLYVVPCREAQKSFTPLVYSVDGMEGTEAKAARKKLASRLSAKWNQTYSQVCVLVRA